jgi:hypothetical protein
LKTFDVVSTCKISVQAICIYTISRQYHAHIRNAQREYSYGEIEYNSLLAEVIPPDNKTLVLTKVDLVKT